MGDYDAALAAWRSAARGNAGHPNIAPWGNEVAALVLLHRLDEAIAEGEEASRWAEASGQALIETYAYAGILGNTGLARLEKGDVPGANADFATAYAFHSDDLDRENFALGLIIAGRFADAQLLLRQIAPPLNPGDMIPANMAACTFLLWGLALRQAPPGVQAANFQAFLGEVSAKPDLDRTTPADLKPLMDRVRAALPRADKPCGTLGEVKAAVSLLE